MTNHTLFVTVDQHGDVMERKVFSVSQGAEIDPENLGVYYEASRVKSMYNEMWWLIPESGSSVTNQAVVVDRAGRSWECALKGSLCILALTETAPEKLSETMTIEFDTDKGRLESIAGDSSDESENHIFKLESVAMATTQELVQIKDRAEKAKEFETFLEATFVPYAYSGNARVRNRVYYMHIGQIEDDARLYRIWSELVRTPKTQYDYETDIIPLVLSALSSGRRWAIKLATEHNDWNKFGGVWDFEGRIVERLVRISGLTIGSNASAWRNWFAEISSEVPAFGRAATDVLVEKASSEDPVVRLFVLKQLSGREDVNLGPILEKAAADEDEEVRKFADGALKKLKEKEEKEKKK